MRPEEAYVLIAELLRMIGVKYINARASGWQGLKLAESMAQVDLMLLDIQLPYEDVYKVLERIRSGPKLKHTCVVAMSANVLPQDEARARAAGFNGLIGKPLDFDRFPQQILTLLSGL